MFSYYLNVISHENVFYLERTPKCLNKKRPNFTIQIKTTEDKLRMPKLYEVQKQQQILPKIIAIQ